MLLSTRAFLALGDPPPDLIVARSDPARHRKAVDGADRIGGAGATKTLAQAVANRLARKGTGVCNLIEPRRYT